MSRLLNPKRKQHSTLTSPKSWQSNLHLTKQTEPGNLKKHQQNQINLERQELVNMELNDPEKKELPFRELIYAEIPKGHGFDKFGLLVQKRFAVEDSNQSIPATRPSSMDSSEETATLLTPDDNN